MRTFLLLNTIINAYSFHIHKFLGNLTCNILYEKFNLTILKDDCSNSSIWADLVKVTNKYKWTKPYHYISLKTCNLKINDVKNYKEYITIYTGLINFTYGLKNDILLQNFTKEEHVKMILHLSQDLFQPLHVYDKDKGGNTYNLIRNKNNRNKSLSLHEFYDNELPVYFLEKFNYIPSYKVENIITYDDYVAYYIVKNLIKACEIYSKITKYIIIESFLKEKFYKELFNDYFTFVISTFLFIFSDHQEDLQKQHLLHYLHYLIRFQALEL